MTEIKGVLGLSMTEISEGGPRVLKKIQNTGK
jgi:hypothetical protein